MDDLRQTRRMDIMLAVDGSEHSMAAARLLRDLPLPAGSLVKILAVLVPREASSHALLEGALEAANEILAGRDIEVESELLTGYPAEMLAEYSDTFQPDLIVMGAKGLRATLGILLGGVVQQVVEYATWPALVVRAPYEGLRRILLVTDGSAYSHRALEYLGAFPLPPAAEVCAMHVLPPLVPPAIVARTWPAGPEAAASFPSYEAEKALARQAEMEEKEGRALLEKTLKRLEADGLPANSVLLRGDAATEILDYVKEHQVDLIVAGARGMSRMRRLLLGSLSRKLVHYAPCSVLIVKGADL